MNNRIKIKALLFAYILLTANNLQAQDSTKQLTLQQAVDMSIRNSKILKISKAKIDEATAQLQEANDSRLPDFKISGSYLRLNSANIELKNQSSQSGSGGSSSSPKINPGGLWHDWFLNAIVRRWQNKIRH